MTSVEETELAITVTHYRFDDWWDPYTLGVGPAGSYVAGLDRVQPIAARGAMSVAPARSTLRTDRHGLGGAAPGQPAGLRLRLRGVQVPQNVRYGVKLGGAGAA